jgi:hypothetical protein
MNWSKWLSEALNALEDYGIVSEDHVTLKIVHILSTVLGSQLAEVKQLV